MEVFDRNSFGKPTNVSEVRRQQRLRLFLKLRGAHSRAGSITDPEKRFLLQNQLPSCDGSAAGGVIRYASRVTVRARRATWRVDVPVCHPAVPADHQRKDFQVLMDRQLSRVQDRLVRCTS